MISDNSSYIDACSSYRTKGNKKHARDIHNHMGPKILPICKKCICFVAGKHSACKYTYATIVAARNILVISLFY